VPTTKQELDSFHRFASEKCVVPPVDASLEDLLALWRQDCEYSETVEDVRQGLRDYDAGMGQALADAFQDVRDNLGFAK
jgi:hypothetical protein